MKIEPQHGTPGGAGGNVVLTAGRQGLTSVGLTPPNYSIVFRRPNHTECIRVEADGTITIAGAVVATDKALSVALRAWFLCAGAAAAEGHTLDLYGGRGAPPAPGRPAGADGAIVFQTAKGDEHMRIDGAGAVRVRGARAASPQAAYQALASWVAHAVTDYEPPPLASN